METIQFVPIRDELGFPSSNRWGEESQSFETYRNLLSRLLFESAMRFGKRPDSIAAPDRC
jgi:hypothetical protein